MGGTQGGGGGGAGKRKKGKKGPLYAGGRATNCGGVGCVGCWLGGCLSSVLCCGEEGGGGGGGGREGGGWGGGGLMTGQDWCAAESRGFL